jgi:starch synthase (maltosyl-transferring)
VVVNLDPRNPQSGFVELPLADWGVDDSGPDAQSGYQAHELLGAAGVDWQGRRAFVTLTPAECPACIYRIQARRGASERDFDYFA